mmetsp:Transcript_76216/g.105425  ORF Transcript_76216/g.105425 Transcript_76216/m.105425 type:complete len:296 (-) Transcript_76216:160-1047(-)|eukprot:scaffold70346_cov35-Tisochrysis_lutea.AAC.1
MAEGEAEYAQYLREHVAPVLSEGMLLALRDQPHDAPAYMAEFLASKGVANAVSEALAERQLADQYEGLEAEMADLQAQLQAARAEARARLPVEQPRAKSKAAEAIEAGEVHCAASWHECLRLKKLMRATKLRLGRPLVASDWLLPTGVVLACSAPYLDAAPLCLKIASDFGARYSSPSENLAHFTDTASPDDDSLHLVERSPSWLLSSPARWSAGSFGSPHMLLTFTAQPDTLRHHARQVGAGEVASAKIHEWSSETLPSIERVAAQAGIPIAHVECDGDVAEQMRNLLCALVST